jgi:DNA repair exonuclease SbcCD nuclease subunit
VIVFSDIHFSNHAEFGRPWKDGCNTRLEEQLKVLTKIFELCEEHSSRDLVFLGDWFHHWKAVDTPVTSAVSRVLYSLLDKHKNVTLHMMPGNHDMPNKSNPGVSTVDAYKGHSRINVYSSPTSVKLCGGELPCVFVPYNQNHEWVRDESLRLLPSKEAWLFAHLDIVGAEASIDGYVSTGGLKLEDLDEYAGGMFGHYHMPQNFITKTGRDFHYVGSPMQLSWVDEMAGSAAEEVRGVMLYKEGRVQRISIDSPKFVKVMWGEDKNVRPEDYVMVTCAPEHADEVWEQCTKLGLPSFKILPHKKVKESKPIFEAPPTVSDAVEAYVKSCGVFCELDLATLLSYGNYYING